MGISRLYMVIVSLSCVSAYNHIYSLEELYWSIESAISTKETRIGFATQANYESVHALLPSSATPVIIPHIQDIENGVMNGSLVAGMISGLPSDLEQFHVFSTTLVSPRTVFLHPDKNESQHLMEALDACIVSIQHSGLDQSIARNHPPFRFVSVHTCKTSPESYAYPEASSVTGKLRRVLDTGVLRVGSLGPYDWLQDGNYVHNPPTGFWPDYLESMASTLGSAYGIPIHIQRTFSETSGGVFQNLLDGEVDITEPYYVVNSLFQGKPRKDTFSMTCTSIGYESSFFTKRGLVSDKDEYIENGVHTTVIAWTIAALSLLSALVVTYRVRSTRKNDKPTKDSPTRINQSKEQPSIEV